MVIDRLAPILECFFIIYQILNGEDCDSPAGKTASGAKVRKQISGL